MKYLITTILILFGFVSFSQSYTKAQMDALLAAKDVQIAFKIDSLAKKIRSEIPKERTVVIPEATIVRSKTDPLVDTIRFGKILDTIISNPPSEYKYPYFTFQYFTTATFDNKGNITATSGKTFPVDTSKYVDVDVTFQFNYNSLGRITASLGSYGIRMSTDNLGNLNLAFTINGEYAPKIITGVGVNKNYTYRLKKQNGVTIAYYSVDEINFIELYNYSYWNNMVGIIKDPVQLNLVIENKGDGFKDIKFKKL